MTKKHPQYILAMDNAFFTNHPEMGTGLVEYSTEEWLKEVQSHLIIRERQMLEQEPQYRQLLPYVFIRQKDTQGTYWYQTYRRTSKVGESRLAGNASAGYGGHIDLVDVCFTDSIINLLATIESAVDREVAEEIHAVDTTRQFELDGLGVNFDNCFILDDSNEVGKVHVGVVMVIDLPAGIDVICSEGELETAAPMTAEQMLKSGLPLENWTRLYMEHQVAKNQA